MPKRLKFVLFALLVGIGSIFVSYKHTTTFKNRYLYRFQQENNGSIQKRRDGSSSQCFYIPQSTNGSKVPVNITPPASTELEQLSTFVTPGGHYRPDICIPDTCVALIIPYRDRENQLRIFLKHMHQFLSKQGLEYTIFVVELVRGITFNRGALFNVGFLEANKTKHFDCYIFHDVDQLPEDTRNRYNCSAMPRHMTAAVDKFSYKMPYRTFFGGAVSMRPDQFIKMNGFSNLYFGWGGEDDDFYRRLQSI